MFEVSESHETQSQWIEDMETKSKKNVPDRQCRHGIHQKCVLQYYDWD